MSSIGKGNAAAPDTIADTISHTLTATLRWHPIDVPWQVDFVNQRGLGLGLGCDVADCLGGEPRLSTPGQNCCLWDDIAITPPQYVPVYDVYSRPELLPMGWPQGCRCCGDGHRAADAVALGLAAHDAY